MLDDVEYSFYNYRVTWEEAKIVCLGYKSQLATLDTQNKATHVTKKFADSVLDFKESWVGSKTNSYGHWIWVATDEKLLPNSLFYNSTTVPKYQSRFTDKNFHCIALFRRYHHNPLFIPRRCSERKPFICEKDTFSINNIIKVFAVNVNKKMFVLYSANLTWSEAVFQCRQQGLQIAEISTLTEARSIAVGMLKARPRSIESAWIAGFINNQVWTWLSSGVEVPQNILWQGSYIDSGNCLLLDRHVCQRPRYLSLRCDRRRDFICQNPQEEDSVSYPLQVAIDECIYWIVKVPSNWFEANQFCKMLNSTLASLDSPATVNHVTNIMLDNKELLRHIWIGGRKESSGDNISEKAIWKWDDTGSVIPGPGQSFIPWCKDSRLFEQNSDCLNMDLEDIDEPVVYGLNCNNKQRYICKKESTICSEMKNLSSLHRPSSIPKIDAIATEFEGTTSSNKSKSNSEELVSPHINLSKTLPISLSTSSYDSASIYNESHRRFDDEAKNHTTASDRNVKSNVMIFDEKNNVNQSSTTTKNFKDIIEYMVKKVNDEKIGSVENTSEASLFGMSNSQSYDKSHDSKQFQVNDRSNKPELQRLSIKENVSKIVQSSMEKKLQQISSTAPTTSVLNLKNFITGISPPTPKREIQSQLLPKSKNLFNTQVDRPLPKKQKEWSKSLVLENNNPNTMFNLGQIMRNTFDKSLIKNFDAHEPTESMDAHKKHTSNTTRNKNEVSTLLPASSTNVEKRIQSLRNDRNKNENNMKVNDLINAFQNSVHDPNLREEFSSVSTDNILGSKKSYVYPWNVLLNRIFQSYNNTNKKVVGFTILELR